MRRTPLLLVVVAAGAHAQEADPDDAALALRVPQLVRAMRLPETEGELLAWRNMPPGMDPYEGPCPTAAAKAELEAMNELDLLGPASGEALLAALDHGDVRTRAGAAWTIVALGRAPSGAVPVLRRAARSGSTDVRRAALAALGALRPDDPSALADVVEARLDPDPLVRIVASSSAWYVNTTSLPVSDRVIDAVVRQDLGTEGPPFRAGSGEVVLTLVGRRAIPALERRLGEGDDAGSWAAARALASMQLPEADAALRRVAAGGTAAARTAVVRTLGRNPAYADVESAALVDLDGRVRAAALEATLDVSAPPSAVLASAREWSQDPAPEVRSEGAVALAHVFAEAPDASRDSACTLALGLLRDDSADVRWMASWGLARVVTTCPLGAVDARSLARAFLVSGEFSESDSWPLTVVPALLDEAEQQPRAWIALARLASRDPRAREAVLAALADPSRAPAVVGALANEAPFGGYADAAVMDALESIALHDPRSGLRADAATAALATRSTERLEALARARSPMSAEAAEQLIFFDFARGMRLLLMLARDPVAGASARARLHARGPIDDFRRPLLGLSAEDSAFLDAITRCD